LMFARIKPSAARADKPRCATSEQWAGIIRFRDVLVLSATATRCGSEDRRMSMGRAGDAPPAAVASTCVPLAVQPAGLESLRESVVYAASVTAGLWLSSLFVLFYLLIATGGVTHRNLFFEDPVKLPFLNVDLPLVAFFVLGPGLFLIVHTYVLLHFSLLAD